MSNSYQALGSMNHNDLTTDPSIPDPINLPIPLGWNILIRPYPVKEKTTGGIILSSGDIDFMNHTTNVGRVVLVGQSCWNRSQHKDSEGNFKPWVEVGEFISYPRHKGAMRKFQGVSFVVLSDDDIMEKLPDPMVFGEGDTYALNIPDEDLEKYKTIYNPNYNKGDTDV